MLPPECAWAVQALAIQHGCQFFDMVHWTCLVVYYPGEKEPHGDRV
jgi:hypothetical protein